MDALIWECFTECGFKGAPGAFRLHEKTCDVALAEEARIAALPYEPAYGEPSGWRWD